MSCSSEGCDKVASTLKCPTCSKKGLPDCFFCTQQCFSDNWGTHKRVHKRQQKKADQFAHFAYTGKLRKGMVTARRQVPDSIERPVYATRADHQDPRESAEKGNGAIHVNSKEEIEIMRHVCKLGRQVLDLAQTLVAAGNTTEQIDAAVHQRCVELGVYPSPLGYSNFPKSCCTSVNEVVCHGIPDSTVLKEGDICNVDISIFYKNHHADLNATYPVGALSYEAEKLIRVTYECLQRAIAMCRPGALYRSLGNVISKHAHKNGFSVIRTYCGHGVGQLFHGPPTVPHYAKNKAVGVMRPGHIFTIEPMINVGTHKDRLWPDDWTSVTRDGKYSAQFEETLLITETGCEILTKGAYEPADHRLRDKK